MSSREDKLALALKELLGFAERNLKRAKIAHGEAKAEWLLSDRDDGDVDLRIMAAKQEAREHEAQRFLDVLQERIAEALR